MRREILQHRGGKMYWCHSSWRNSQLVWSPCCQVWSFYEFMKNMIVSLRLKLLLHINSLLPSRDYTNLGWKILKPTCLKLLCVKIREHKRGCTTTPVVVPGIYIYHLKFSFLKINESFIVIPTMGASQAHLSAFNCCALWPWVYHHHHSYFSSKRCVSLATIIFPWNGILLHLKRPLWINWDWLFVKAL